MSKHDDGVRLHHMLDAALKAREFITGRTRTELNHDFTRLTRRPELSQERLPSRVKSSIIVPSPCPPWTFTGRAGHDTLLTVEEMR